VLVGPDGDARPTIEERVVDEATKKKLTQTIIDQAFDLGNVEPIPPDLVATLRVVEGDDRGQALRLDRSVITIGRGSACDLVLSDDRVSADHLTISFRNGEFRVRDNESTNGTLLNGSPVTEYALRDGDQIRVGHTVFQMEIDFKLDMG